MNLDTTSKVLQIVLGEAKTTNDCDIVSSFADSSVTSFSLGNTNVKSNGTTPVSAVGAPGASVQRQVKEVRLFNNDTVAHTVTLQLFDGASAWVIAPSAVSVPVNGSFVYTPDSGVCCTSGGGGTSLTVEDDTGHTIASVGTLQMVGVVVSGSSPSAITNMRTITGADGVGTTAGTGILLRGGAGQPGGTLGQGQAIYLYGGNGGFGTGNTYGGFVVGNGGAGGSGTIKANGGNLFWGGGPGGTLATYGAGGSAAFNGGSGYGTGKGGVVGLYGGVAYGTGQGGDAQFASGSAMGGGAAGNAQIILGAGAPKGRLQIENDASLIVGGHSWVAGDQLDNQTIFTTTRAMVVTAVIGRPDVVNGSAATLVIVKAASGTAPSGGTPLTSTSMDLTGTPDTNQTLTLSATLADITLAPGDSLCMTTTGVLAASAGCITIWGTPQ